MKKLSPQYLSRFCLELRLLLRAGIEPGEGLDMLCGGHRDRISKVVASSLCRCDKRELPLSEKLLASGLFPQYFTDTVRLGEKSGKLDDALSNLSAYYKRRARLTNGLRGAVTYPLLLFLAMTAVVIVLITQVLPVFDEIYAQLGTQMTGLAVSFLRAGRLLVSLQAVILAALAAFLVTGIAIYLIPPVRRTASRGLGDKGIFGRVSATKFVSAMSMAVSSGLDPVQAVNLAGDICRASGGMCRKIDRCRQYLERGENLEDCLSKARIFSERDSRLFSLGNSAGSTGEVMEEIAKSCEEKVAEELDAKLKRLGPLMVIAVCIIVGLTLLSVMLPTLGILSSLS